MIIAIILVFYLARVLHDLGHVLAARLLLPRTAVRQPPSATGSPPDIPHRVAALLASPARGSRCGVTPGGHRRRWRAAIVAAAGPLTTLAFVAVCAAAATAGSSADRLLLGGGAFISLVLCGFDLLPTHSERRATDGAALLALLRGGVRGQRRAAIFALQRAVVAGQRPREWDAQLVEDATTIAGDPSDEVAGCLYGYYHALDRGDCEAAGEFMRRMLEIPVAPRAELRPIVLMEAAYVAARFERDSARAAAYVEAAQGTDGLSRRMARMALIGRRMLVARVDAARALARGEPRRAQELLLAALAGPSDGTTNRGPTRAQGAACEREWAAGLLAEAEQQTRDCSAESEVAAAAQNGFPAAATPDRRATHGFRPALVGSTLTALYGLYLWTHSDPNAYDSFSFSIASLRLLHGVSPVLAALSATGVALVLATRRAQNPRPWSKALIAAAGATALAVIAYAVLDRRAGFVAMPALITSQAALMGSVCLLRLSGRRREQMRRRRLSFDALVAGLALVAMVWGSAIVLLGQGRYSIQDTAAGQAQPGLTARGLPPFQRRYLFDPRIPEATRQAVRDGVQLAQDHFAAVFGATIQQPVLIEVRTAPTPTDSLFGSAARHRVVIHTAYYEGQYLAAPYIMQTAIHELFHVLQSELSEGESLTRGPVWLVEGSARLLEDLALNADDPLSEAELRDCLLTAMGSDSPSLRPLRELYDPATVEHHGSRVYALAALGAQQAIAARGEASLGAYFRELARTNWQTAFQRAFGVSPDAFYTAFDAARAGFLPPDTDPCDYGD